MNDNQHRNLPNTRNARNTRNKPIRVPLAPIESNVNPNLRNLRTQKSNNNNVVRKNSIGEIPYGRKDSGLYSEANSRELNYVSNVGGYQNVQNVAVGYPAQTKHVNNYLSKVGGLIF